MSVAVDLKRNRDEDRGIDIFDSQVIRAVDSPDEPSTTAVLYLSDDEPRSGTQRVSKRMVHNEVERRRKSKINTFIHRLADLLPLANGRKLSKNDILEKAVEYIKEIKDDLHKALEGHLNEAQVSEYKRLQNRILDLEQTNAAYANLLQIAGIPLNADPAAVWPPNTKYSNKIDPDSASCLENSLKETKQTALTSSEPKNTAVVASTVMASHVAAPTAVYETLVTNSTNGVTAVTQSLTGAPIMSTAQTAQQIVPPFQQLLNLGGMVNIVSGMQTIQGHASQSVLLINDQGMPIIQTGPQNMMLSGGQQQQQQYRFFGSPANSATATGHQQQPSILQSGSVVLGHNNGTPCHQTVTGTGNQLPSALVLPNGQVIPVVSQPSLLYPSTGSIGGSLIVTTPTASAQSPLTMEQQQHISSPTIFVNHRRPSTVPFSQESNRTPALAVSKPIVPQQAAVSRPSEATQSAAISSSSAALGGTVDGNKLQSGVQLDSNEQQSNNRSKRPSSQRTRPPKNVTGCKRSRGSKSSPKPTPAAGTPERSNPTSQSIRPVAALKDILAKATESIFDFEVETEVEGNAEKQPESTTSVGASSEKNDCECPMFSEGTAEQRTSKTATESNTESDILSDLVADVYREDVAVACDRVLAEQEKPEGPADANKDLDLAVSVTLSPKARRELDVHMSDMQDLKKQRTEPLSVSLASTANQKESVVTSRDTTSFMSVSQLACSASLVTSPSTTVSSTSATFSSASTVPSCLMDVAVSSDSSPFGSISPLLTSPCGNKGVTAELSFMHQPMTEDAANYLGPGTTINPPYSCTAFASTPLTLSTSSTVTTTPTGTHTSFSMAELSFGDALSSVSVVSEPKGPTTSVVFSNVHSAPQMCHPLNINTHENSCVSGNHSPRAHIPVRNLPSNQRPPSSNARPSLPPDIMKNKPNTFLTSSHSINTLVPSVNTMASHGNHNHHHQPSHQPPHHDSSISPKLGHHPHHISAVSPARNPPPQPTPPHSSPAPFVPRHSPGISATVSQPQESVSLLGVDAFRDMGYPVHRKQAPHQRSKAPVGSGINTTTTTTTNNHNSGSNNSNSNNNSLQHVSRSAPISYSAESLIRTQTQQRPNCAREVHGGLQQSLGPMPSVASLVSQPSRNSQRESSTASNFHYFPFPSHSHAQMEHPAGGPGPTQPHLNHLLPPVNPGTASSATHRGQPNFTFGHSQATVASNESMQEEPTHLGFGQMGYGNYGSGSAQKEGMPRHQSFMGVHGMTACSSGGQTPGHHGHHHHHHGIDSGFSGGSFPELYGSIGVARSDGANAAAAMAANASKSKKPEHQSASRVTKGNKQSTAGKKKQQQSVPQNSVEEINLSNSIFETGRGGGTPYFSVPSLSPPRNDGPTYLPPPNGLFNGPQRHTGPSSAGMVQVHHQSKPPDLGPQPAYNPLLAPRTQTGLNLNFQAPSFRVNHLHGNVANQITPQQPPQHANVPNFNLSNIFPDMNNASSDGLNISPIKFHTGNHHILPPPPPAPQPPVDPNALQHPQTGPLYHNRPHGHPPPPPPVLHNGMSINSLLGHNPHGFDGRPQVQVPMAINNGVAPPPFHGHGHSSSFGNMLTTLNFTAHDH